MSTRTDRGATSRDSQVDLMHGWGEDSEMMLEFEDGFERHAPGVTLNGMSVSNISLEAKRRILTEEPPDLWASWVGPNLQPYHNAGVLRDVTDVWTESGMERAFHDVAKDAVRFDGAYRGVPLNVQRTNLLFANLPLVEKAGVDPGRVDDLHEFVELLAQVDDAIDEDPLVVGFVQPFASQGLYMWEAIYLALHDERAYLDLVEGDSRSRRSEAKQALSMLEEILGYANDDAINTTEGTESGRFANGDGVFRMQGMWAGLNLSNTDLEYGTGWDAMALPGTGGQHVVNMDGLAVPSNAPHPESTAAFVEFVGSVDGIEGFNRAKRSIPTRTDVPTDGLPPFVAEQTEAFRRSNSHLPSVAHGLAAPPETLVDLEVAFADYISSRDADAAAGAIVDAFASE